MDTPYKLDYKTIMNYFPPVNPNIEDIYKELDYTYTTYYSIFPLKLINNKDVFYSYNILSNLRTLRILLNGDLSQGRFIYELNKLLNAWGPDGFYNESILNSLLVKDINIINNKYQKLLEYTKQAEIMKISNDIVLDHQIKELEGDIKRITFKPKPDRNIKIKDLDFSKLNLNTHSKLIKKNNKKSKK